MKRSFRFWQTPEAVRSDDYRLFLVLNTLGMLGVILHVSLVIVFQALGFWYLSLLNVGSSVIWLYAWIANQRGQHIRAVLLTTVEVMIHSIIVVPLVGWHAGFQYYLIGAVPVTLFNNRLRTRIILFLSVSLFVLYVLLYALNHDATHILEQPSLGILNYFNILYGFTALVVTSYFFRIASMMAEDEMEILATTDTLTGLFNRRKMTEFLETQKVLFERTDLKFAIILADIDHFKRVNDSFGHDCGDFVLQEVANLMRERLRQSDVLARWGGEEFLIMLPDSDTHAAKLVAEVLRHSIEQKTMQCSGESFHVTLSMGVAEHQTNSTLNASLKTADEALYQAKEGGRNQVVG